MKTSARSVIPAKKRCGGFTLIEVMITVAILAIIASVALPSYIDYVTRSKIVEAKTNLSDMRTRSEQHFLDNRRYPSGCDDPGGALGVNNIYKPASQKYFSVTCAYTDTTYTITATGTGSMAGFVYTINQANVHATTGTGSWGKTSTTCWVSRKNGDCS